MGSICGFRMKVSGRKEGVEMMNHIFSGYVPGWGYCGHVEKEIKDGVLTIDGTCKNSMYDLRDFLEQNEEFQDYMANIKENDEKIIMEYFSVNADLAFMEHAIWENDVLKVDEFHLYYCFDIEGYEKYEDYLEELCRRYVEDIGNMLNKASFALYQKNHEIFKYTKIDGTEHYFDCRNMNYREYASLYEQIVLDNHPEILKALTEKEFFSKNDCPEKNLSYCKQEFGGFDWKFLV